MQPMHAQPTSSSASSAWSGICVDPREMVRRDQLRNEEALRRERAWLVTSDHLGWAFFQNGRFGGGATSLSSCVDLLSRHLHPPYLCVRTTPCDLDREARVLEVGGDGGWWERVRIRAALWWWGKLHVTYRL